MKEASRFQVVQQEIGIWARNNFGPNLSKDPTGVHNNHPLGSLPPLLGVLEELGELTAPILKSIQGRWKGSVMEAQEAKEDAIGDLLIFLSDFACREGIDLEEVLVKTWDKVRFRRQKTWNEDKAKE